MAIYEHQLETATIEREECSRPSGRLHWAEYSTYVVEATYDVKTHYDSVDAIIEDIFVNPAGFDDFSKADEILKVELITKFETAGGVYVETDKAILVTWTYNEPVLDENDNETDEIVKYTSVVNYEHATIEIGTIV